MDLASEYNRQFSWRSWPTILDALPALAGQTVLDLGCGPGDVAAALAARGARVLGVDLNEELLRAAGAQHVANVEFRKGDLRALPDLGVVADGLWSSFSAAYFPDLPAMLRVWGRCLREGGWVALTEVDDLFGHEPLGGRTRSLLAAYAGDALLAGHYDFHMGRKLRAHLELAGFTVSREMNVGDRELAFDGVAEPDVIEAWRRRFERMRLLQNFCGAEFGSLRDEFLACLGRADHRSLARVVCCIATRRVDDGYRDT
jgi:SAM-dependent methyltransferase